MPATEAKYRHTTFSGGEHAKKNPFIKINPETGEPDPNNDISFRYKSGDKEERKRRAALLANLGLVAQGAIFLSFENGHKRGKKKLKDLFGRVSRRVSKEAEKLMQKEYPGSKKPIRSWVAEDVYMAVAGLEPDSTRTRRPVEDLLKTVDRYFGTDLFARCKTLINEDSGSIVYVRFLIDVALSLADLASRAMAIPPDLAFVPNLIYMDSESKLVAQIDGILAPREHVADNCKLDLDSVMTRGIPYSLLEFKFLFRTKHTLNPKTVRHPRQEDIRYVKEQLARIAFARIDRGYEDFRLPEEIVFSYLRGPQGRTTRGIVVDEKFVQDWIDGLEKYNFQEGTPEEVVRQTSLLMYLLYREKDRIKNEREMEYKTTIDLLTQQISEGISTAPLFYTNGDIGSFSRPVHPDFSLPRKKPTGNRRVRLPGIS